MRHEKFPADAPRRSGPNSGPSDAVSDRALAIASYVALVFCIACLAVGLLKLRTHGVF